MSIYVGRSDDLDLLFDGSWRLVWQGEEPAPAYWIDILLAAFDDDGNLSFPIKFLSDYQGSDGPGHPTVSSDGALSWIAWHEQDNGMDTVDLTALDSSGVVIVPETTAVATTGRQPILSYDAQGGMGLIWQAIVPPLTYFGSNVASDGSLSGTTEQLSPGTTTAGDPEGQLAAFGGGYAFGYRSTISGPFYGDLYYNQLDTNMDPTASPIQLTFDEDAIPLGNIVWTGVGLLWPVNGIELFRLTKEGRLLGRQVITQPGAVPTGRGPRAAMSDRALGVVWEDRRSGSPSIWYDYVPTINLVFGAGADPAAPPSVKSRSAFAGEPVLDMVAYATASYGASVASGSIDPQPLDEVLTGPGPGPIHGPQVRAFTGVGDAVAKVNFYAYGTLRAGVHVASADLDGDGMAEILTGPGPQPVFGPHVRGFNYDGASVQAIGKVNLFAYQTLRYGVEVGSGDVDADTFEEILTGPGPGQVFGAQLRGFDVDGGSVSPMTNVNAILFPTRYGLIVAGGDMTADGRDDIVASAGPDTAASSEVKVFDLPGNLAQIASVTPFTTTGGAHVAVGDMTLDGRDELVVTPGFLPANPGRSKAFDYATGTLVSKAAWDQDIYPGLGYGATCAVGNLGM